MAKTIILTGGGTAGHVIPNIALLPRLHKIFDRIIYIGSDIDIERKLLAPYEYVEYFVISTIKLKRGFSIKNLTIPFVLLKGRRQAIDIIDEVRPSVIFSKGGYVALPVVLAGAKRKVPLIAHESDLSLGLANRLVKNKFETILTTFKDTANALKNGVYIGAITRENITKGNGQKFRATYKLKENKPVLLVLGGSQGAAQINTLVRKNIEKLTKDYQVIHITGKGKLDNNIKNKDYHQIEFYDRIQDIYAITDICITRGGSNTIFELLYNHIPMLIIPLQKGSRGDQVDNAKYFEEHNYSVALIKKEIDNAAFITGYNTLKAKAKNIRSSLSQFNITHTVQEAVKYISKYVNKNKQ